MHLLGVMVLVNALLVVMVLVTTGQCNAGVEDFSQYNVDDFGSFQCNAGGDSSGQSNAGDYGTAVPFDSIETVFCLSTEIPA